MQLWHMHRSSSEVQVTQLGMYRSLTEVPGRRIDYVARSLSSALVMPSLRMSEGQEKPLVILLYAL